MTPVNRITPAGHSGITINKEYAEEPSSRIEEIFDEWKQGCAGTTFAYGLATNVFRDFRPRIGELHSCILKRASSGTGGVGEFLSAGYNRSDEHIIFHDLDLALDTVGLLLGNEKLLVNKGTAGKNLGHDSLGVLVDLGMSDRHSRTRIGGLTVYMNCKEETFIPAHNGIVISYPSTIHACGNPLPEEIPRRLRPYLDELIETCKGSTEDVQSRYGPTPGATIMRDVQNILGAGQ